MSLNILEKHLTIVYEDQMNLKQRFKGNPQIITIRKNGKVMATSIDSDESEVIELEGPIGEFLMEVNETKTIEEIAHKLNISLKETQTQEDFKRMVQFLLDRKLIYSAETK